MPVDRTRRFSLPGIQELNKDQDEALALPLEGQHLIVGGPGTGKSVVALLRARRLANEGRDYQVLVYNRLLDNSNRYLFGERQEFVARTWDSWFRTLYGEVMGSPIPTFPPENNRSFRAIDWETVEQRVQSLIEVDSRDGEFLIIDEGQDMPPAFYRTLVQLGFENFYVVADQNQQIFPDKCSSRREIEDILVIDLDDTLELKINYRNTRRIAQLARHFYPADPASPKPELPNDEPAASVPELLTYGDGTSTPLNNIASAILQLSDRDPKKLIGVITPDNRVRKRFYRALNTANPILDNEMPPMQTYYSGFSEPLRFNEGGLMVINAQSCKGLEFDVAILADIDQHQPKHNPHTLKARFYVMVARARDDVILLRTGDVCSVVNSLLPDDPDILKRR